MINSMPSVLIGFTHQGYVTHWNASAAFNTGISADEALHRHLNEVYPAYPSALQPSKKPLKAVHRWLMKTCNRAKAQRHVTWT
jgi:PAS domain-containing protein